MTLKRLLEGFSHRVHSGDSWLVLGSLLVVCFILVFCLSCRRSIFSDWAFEPLVKIPNRVEKLPLIQKWFRLTRGYHYGTQLDEKTNPLDTFKGPVKGAKIVTNCFFSGWAFLHCFMHFLMAFLCPKLAYISFICGVLWEIIESSNSSHDALDIMWNTSGCLLGLLTRSILI